MLTSTALNALQEELGRLRQENKRLHAENERLHAENDRLHVALQQEVTNASLPFYAGHEVTAGTSEGARPMRSR